MSALSLEELGRDLAAIRARAVREEAAALRRISLRQRAARTRRELRAAGPRPLRFPSGKSVVSVHAMDADERSGRVKL